MANANKTPPTGRPGSPAPMAPQSAPRKSPWKLLVVTAIVLALVVMGVLLARRRSESAAAGKAGPQGRGQSGPVTAVIGSVTNKDVPIYLDGLGTVQAFNTVTIRTRMDGQLQKVAFQEGQDVRAGDLLA